MVSVLLFLWKEGRQVVPEGNGVVPPKFACTGGMMGTHASAWAKAHTHTHTRAEHQCLCLPGLAPRDLAQTSSSSTGGLRHLLPQGSGGEREERRTLLLAHWPTPRSTLSPQPSSSVTQTGLRWFSACRSLRDCPQGPDLGSARSPWSLPFPYI